MKAGTGSSAGKYVAGTRWRADSVVTGDFTCRGRKQHAILGTNAKEIVVAVFLNDTDHPPEVLRYSAETRNPASVVLALESQDYDPRDEVGDVPGFRRSKTCKGLNLSDGQTDSAHIYWNHDAKRFDDWTL
jgi:hypothetical protein